MFFNNKILIIGKKINYLIINQKRKYVSNKIGKIAGAYQPQLIENPESIELITKKFKYNQCEHEKPFTIILPPPNVTGKLHLGHALMCTIQDVIVRWKYSNGYNPVWIPGTDHAGIATQIIVEKQLYKEHNKTRHDIGREQFLKKVSLWKNEQSQEIREDLKRLGTNLDWSKEYFTMDNHHLEAVTEAFIQLFNQGYIYRKETLINWSCTLESAISDIEVENRQINGPTSILVPGYTKPIVFGELYNIAYRICDNSNLMKNNQEIIVSTTRPETILGDVAVAVHPTDIRYNNLKNIKLWHPFRNETIPLIFDESVDPKFGTGAVKITPAHNKIDFEIAQRHSLPIIPIFNEKGVILNGFQEKFGGGLKRFDARLKIKNELNKLGLLGDIKPHTMTLPFCSRSNDVIEYLLKPQWFVSCKELAKNAINLIEQNEIEIQPESFKCEWKRWLSNCHDWCISRQLWWGHQIPIYKCQYNDKLEWIAAKSLEECKDTALKKFTTNSKDLIIIERDTDVLDTWFSSAILPFSVFGWPHQNINNLQNVYPLHLMETGHDILFFWVARMVMLAQVLTNSIPFKTILLHGIICDAHGRKMSKSLGNVITPKQVIYGITLKELHDELRKSYNIGLLSLDEMKKSIIGQEKLYPNGIPECGTDALRFTFCGYNIKNHFINFDVNECFTNKLFFNKIWQATRFTIGAHENQELNINEIPSSKDILTELQLSLMDKWILSRLGNTIEIVNQSMNEYNFYLVVTAIRTFFYTNFCDIYLETTKPEIGKKYSPIAKSHCTVLKICLSIGLEKMSSITPFLSNKLLQYLPNCSHFDTTKWINLELEQEIEQIIEICSTIRHLKSQNNIIKKYQPKVHILLNDSSDIELLQKYQQNIQILTKSIDILIYKNINDFNLQKFCVKSSAGHLCAFGISVNEDYYKYQRQQQNIGNKIITIDELNAKKIEKLQMELEKIEKIISNIGYQKSANDIIKMKHLDKLKQLQIEIDNIKSISS